MTTSTMRDVGGRKLAPADLDEFRAYVRSWVPEGLPPREPVSEIDLEQRLPRHRDLQRRLWDAGLAGIVYPLEYGGIGLTREHQVAFLEETDGYETPVSLAVTLGILIPTLLECGSEEQKHLHIPAALRGEEMWVQLLSEPGAGSDMAGVLTKAVRDGETYVLNGAKIWTTSAHVADYGMALCRTDPDVEKHRGLSMISVPLVRSEHLTINPIRLATGVVQHFCEEFFDDLVVPAANLVGAENDGWTVALRLLFHERNMIGDASYHDTRAMTPASSRADAIVELARSSGVADDPAIRQLVGEALTLKGLEPYTVEWVSAEIARGVMPPPAASLLKLLSGLVDYRRSEISMEVAEASGVVWDPAEDDTAPGVPWLGARIRTIGGGTNEAQRNVISERVLGLPREHSPEKGRPFSEVRHNP